MDAGQLLRGEAEPYYGKNDYRPWSSGTRVIVGLIVLAGISLVAMNWPMQLVYWPIGVTIYFTLAGFCLRQSMHGAMKIVVFDSLVFKAPGKRLQVRSNGGASSDVVIADDMVDDKGNLYSCGGRGWSLRKSIECTVEEHLRQGAHGQQIAGDTDVDRRRYHVHGRAWKYDASGENDPSADEMWTCGAPIAMYPALYCVAPRMPQGSCPWCWSERIDLTTAPDVLGYIYLFEVSNPAFFQERSRIVRVGAATKFTPSHTPETEGRIFARYGYAAARMMGNLNIDGSEPDAYIFKGKTLEEAQIKVLHTYRIVKPARWWSGSPEL